MPLETKKVVLLNYFHFYSIHNTELKFTSVMLVNLGEGGSTSVSARSLTKRCELSDSGG